VPRTILNLGRSHQSARRGTPGSDPADPTGFPCRDIGPILDPTSGQISKPLKSLALPREAHYPSEFNSLLEGLGRKCPIELQSVS
jgi:hypothetical protein